MTQTRPRFGIALAVTLVVLVVVAGIGVAVSLTQGPRISGVQVDTTAIAQSSGQRVVFTTNQALAAVDPSQVSVEPAAPFTLAASGRHLAVQFTYPLKGDTDYTVTIAGAQGVSGGPTATLTHAFHTVQAPLYLLQRRPGQDDAVFASNLAGDQAVPVFTHAQIEDVRVADDGFIVETSNDDKTSTLTAVSADGSSQREITLPGTGSVDNLQVADHGGLVGYTFTAADVATDATAIQATLFISRIDDPTAEPQRIDVGEDARVVQWAFVPETSSLLILTFDGQLRLVDTAKPTADPVALGNAVSIDGIERGTGKAIIERVDGSDVVDLTTLQVTPLVQPADAASLGTAGPVTPDIQGATIRWYTQMGADGYPTSQQVVRVEASGDLQNLLTLSNAGDAIMQACASPNGQYVAVTIAPNLVDNPYDLYQRPLPTTLETHIVEVPSGRQISVLAGSDPGWCVSASSATL